MNSGERCGPMSNNIEVEIKVRVKDKAPLLEFLTQHGRKESQGTQKDEYFTPAHRDFLTVTPIKEWLRLRSEHGRSSVNYKNWQYEADGKAYGCNEYETAISDPANFINILDALNFRPLIIVEKDRTIYTYEEYEIALDTVTDLGDFVEVEYKGNQPIANYKEQAGKMLQFLKDVGCEVLEQDFEGYPFGLLKKKGLVSS